MQKAIIAIAAIVIIGGGGYLVLHKGSDNKSKKSESSTTQSSSPATDNSSEQSPPTSSQPATATITYSDSGFSPSTVTVKSGDTIAINNTSSRDIQFDSDPHPDHTDDEELNVGIVAPGQSMTFKVGKTGSHGYHNHLNPSDTGMIIVR